MRTRVLPIVCLALCACGKPEKTEDAPQAAAPPAATKSSRSADFGAPPPLNRMSEAIQKAEAVSSPEERTRALTAAIWDAADTEPGQAREGIRKLPVGSEERNGLVGHLAMRLAETDVDEAVRWAGSLDSDEEKSLALGNVALVISTEDPEKAARLLSDSGVAGRDFDVSLIQVVQRWAATSPADAAAWVVLFDAGEARIAAMKEVVSVWAARDVRTAAAWINGNTDATLHQEGVEAMAEAILNQPDSIQQVLLQGVTPEMKAAFAKLKAAAEQEEAADPAEE